MLKLQVFQWIFVVIFIIKTNDAAKLRYRPVNTAVFKDEPAMLNCSAIDPTVVYDTTNWVFRGSQTEDDYIIAQKFVIPPNLQERFKLPDSDSYHLLNTKVDQHTTGLYECVGFANNVRKTYYHAYLSAIDKTPKCAKVSVPSQDYIPNKDIAYCHTEYAGNWAPKVKIQTANDVMNFGLFTSHDSTSGKYSIAGACGLITKGDSFTCDFDFEDPPYEIVYDKSYDDERPTFDATKCANPTNVDTDVPAYLKEKCLEFLKLPDKNTRPTNTVARLDSSTTLKCNDIKEGEHDAGSFSLIQSQTGEAWLLTDSFQVYDHLKNLFRFDVANVFDLTILDTTTQLTGKYSCAGYKNGNLTDSYSAFVLAMDVPKCKRKAHSNLGVNQNLAFCFNDYAGNWAPKVTMTDKNGDKLNHATFNNPMIGTSAPASSIGACSLVTDDVRDSFKCSMVFEEPPENLLKDAVTDRSAPVSSPETCDSSDGLPSIPGWLLTKCEDHYSIIPETTVAPTTKPTTKMSTVVTTKVPTVATTKAPTVATTKAPTVVTTKAPTQATTKVTTTNPNNSQTKNRSFSIFFLAIFSSIVYLFHH